MDVIQMDNRYYNEAFFIGKILIYLILLTNNKTLHYSLCQSISCIFMIFTQNLFKFTCYYYFTGICIYNSYVFDIYYW